MCGGGGKFGMTVHCFASSLCIEPHCVASMEKVLEYNKDLTMLPTSVVEWCFATLPKLDAVSLNFLCWHHKLSSDCCLVFCSM